MNGYIHGENRFFFLMAFIDVFTRKVIDYHIWLKCTAGYIITTLQTAIEKSGANISNLVIRSDNGSQRTAHMFQDHVSNINLEHEFTFTPVRCPNKNAFIESFFSIYETEFLQVHIFDSFGEAYERTIWFINFYNKKRIHGSLNKKSPEEFLKDWTENRVSGYMKVRA